MYGYIYIYGLALYLHIRLDSFLGYRTTNSSATNNSEYVSANISVSDSIFERFISAYTVHGIDGWEYDQACGVY